MKKTIIILVSLLFVTGCTGLRGIHSVSQFSDEQISLITSGNPDSPMRILNIYDKQDSLLLRTKAENIIPDTGCTVLRSLVQRMYATVNDSLTAGVGIAAPQVGILKNIVWVQRYDKPGNPWEVFFNPVIVTYSGKKLKWREGCLSVPGMKDTTNTRSYSIFLEYLKPDSTPASETVEGFTAIIFQHEIDHLNGIIYLDRRK